MKKVQASLALLFTLLQHVAAVASLAARDPVPRPPSLGQLQAEPRHYPVTKVITLLTDMQKQLERESEEDEEVYDKMICWCEANDRDKTQSLKDIESRMAELTTLIETTAARSATLGQEIVQHEQELAKSKEAFDTATSLREKQVAEFSGEEKDMLQSIQALQAAIIVLSKHHRSASFLEDTSLVRDSLQTVQYQMQRHLHMLRGKLTPHQRKRLLAFAQSAQQQSYEPASGEIFGILRQMKDTFESNLAETQTEEAANRKAYEELQAAKQAEITATQQALDEKKTRKAESDMKNANAKEEIEDLRASLTVDNKFLQDLKVRCATTREEYATRVQMRNQELAAVAEAIKILNDDRARDTFSKVMNPASLLQRRAATREKHNDRRSDVAQVLAAAGRRASNPKLVALAVAARLDPLTKVKAAIDKLINELLAEKKQEAAKRDTCVERTNENQRLTEQYTRDQADLQSKIEGYQTTVKETQEAVATLQNEIAEMNLQIKRKGEDRELENKDFQHTVADQREMQTLLQKALLVLKAVYKQSDGVVNAPPSFLQHSAMHGQEPPPPPEGFAAYGQGRASGGVIGLLESIVADTKALEQETVHDEQVAQEDYERVVKDTNASIQAKQTQILNQNSAKASAEQLNIAGKEDLTSKTVEIGTLHDTAKALALDCNFIMRNFQVRMEGRDEEVEALRQAKAILSGMRI